MNKLLITTLSFTLLLHSSTQYIISYRGVLKQNRIFSEKFNISPAMILKKNYKIISKITLKKKSYKNITNLLKSKITCKIIVSNKINLKGHFLHIIPKNIYIGIGCNRGTKSEEIESAVLKSLEKLNITINSVNSISSFELKSDEPGLIAFADKYSIRLKFYNKDELNSVKENYIESDYLIKNIGVKGVCEPSAILSAKRDMRKCLKRKTLQQNRK